MKHPREKRLMILLITAVLFSVITAEVFTALADMEDLFETEAVLINNLEWYVQSQEQKLNYLRSRVSEFKKEHNLFANDTLGYVSNPINAYLLTKRLTSDWKICEQIMVQNSGNEIIENITMHRHSMKFPSGEDLNGAAVALIRLQDTYNLAASSIARGELNGIKYSSEMSSHDCFEIGRQSYLNEDYHHTTLWMREAYNRLPNNTDEIMNILKGEILEYLTFSIYKQGNIQLALEFANEWLKLFPDHEKANKTKAYYEKELAKEMDANQQNIEEEQTYNSTHNDNDRHMYEQLCRGELEPTPQTLSQLKCRYVTNKSLFLKIAPLKLEEVSLSPHIVIYHDVMYDGEIELIKQMAKPRFRRAFVHNSITGELEIANYRISKSAWFKDEDHEVVQKIGLRVEDMTGLSIRTAEELQVVNYGIGGHYVPHYDFVRRGEVTSFDTGNRIATVLFYMSDVEQGGATVFPPLSIAIWPKKGAAAFWYNLYASGEGDYLTQHAACPVLIGSKWVSNKWIHEHGQEFLRPCNLKADHQAQ